MKQFILLGLLALTLASTTLASTGSISVVLEAVTPLPDSSVYRGMAFTVKAVVYNNAGSIVNATLTLHHDPFILVEGENPATITVYEHASRVYVWVLKAPVDAGFSEYYITVDAVCGNESITLSIPVRVVARNITAVDVDLQGDSVNGYRLVVSNPLSDIGQYIIENMTVVVEAWNTSVKPSLIFIQSLPALSNKSIPLNISFTGSDIGLLVVNATARDDVHGDVVFNYSFIVLNATARLVFHVVDDSGKPLVNASVILEGVLTYSNTSMIQAYTNSSGVAELVAPVGVYNYTVTAGGRSVSNTILASPGLNNISVVVDFTPPVLRSVSQDGYRVIVDAFDPGLNASGVALVVFSQNGLNYTYPYPSGGVGVFNPPLQGGVVRVVVVDAQGNPSSPLVFEYVKPREEWSLTGFLVVLILVALILLVLTLTGVLTGAWM